MKRQMGLIVAANVFWSLLENTVSIDLVVMNQQCSPQNSGGGAGGRAGAGGGDRNNVTVCSERLLTFSNHLVQPLLYL